MTQVLTIFESDIGTRRIDAEVIDDIEMYSVVMDKNEINGNGIPCGYVTWSNAAGFATIDYMQGLRQKIDDALAWLEE